MMPQIQSATPIVSPADVPLRNMSDLKAVSCHTGAIPLLAFTEHLTMPDDIFCCHSFAEISLAPNLGRPGMPLRLAQCTALLHLAHMSKVSRFAWGWGSVGTVLASIHETPVPTSPPA